MPLENKIIITKNHSMDPSFYHITGISRAVEADGILIINKKNKIIISSPLDKKVLRAKGFLTVSPENRKELENIIKKNTGKMIGLNFPYISLQTLDNLKKILGKREFVDVSHELEENRSVKNKTQIASIREACKITEEVLSFVKEVKGKTEKDVADELDFLAKRNGSEGFSFPTMVASRENSSMPHHSSGKTKIKDGILLIDMGVIYNGYCSDLTRTFSIGKATDEQRNLYFLLTKAKKAAEKTAKKGVRASLVHKAAEKEIESIGKLPYSIGHGIGILAHDMPASLGPNSVSILKDGMCITIEPGFHKLEFGIRIEDDYVIKGTARAFAKAPEELLRI